MFGLTLKTKWSHVTEDASPRLPDRKRYTARFLDKPAEADAKNLAQVLFRRAQGTVEMGAT